MSTHRCDDYCDHEYDDHWSERMFDGDFVKKLVDRILKLQDEIDALRPIIIKAEDETIVARSQAATAASARDLAEARKEMLEAKMEAANLRTELEVACQIAKEYERQLYPKPEDSSTEE